MNKPRRVKLTLAEIGYFDEVDRYIRRQDIHGYQVVQAFSDVHDGGLYLEEVRRLIRMQIGRASCRERV